MFNRNSHIAILIVMLISIMSPAMGQRKNAFTINDEQMVLSIDLKLGKKTIDSLLKIADIQGVNAAKLTTGDFSEIEKMGWAVKKVANQLIISKPLEELGRNPQIQPYIITQSFFGNDNSGHPGYPGAVMYGVNNFGRVTVHELPSGLTRFFLPGNLTAKKILLSGNFNNWNTLKGIMLKTDSGWIGDIKLQPGEYLYKFVVNGRWMPDANNNLKDDDGFDGHNSVYFRYNYTFKLAGYSTAKRVTLTGSFNNFNGNELVMTPKNGTWIKTLFLAEGLHTYRFLVDAQPVTDPANPNKGVDNAGKPVSVINQGTQVTFKLKGFPNAKNVILSGDFNGWKTNEIHLKHNPDGWALTCVLPVGNYGYKFIVDGNWMRDPANPQTVMFSGETNSFIAVKPTHTFVLHGYGNARTIRLAGTFNNWAEDGYTLKHEGGDWKISLNLKPGKYLYKFIVDGNWIIDPGNKLWEQNEHNTGNSVLWMEQ